jgi:glycosyltransferase involved in cell wall biosynthesis
LTYNTKKLGICILTSARIFDIKYGGEGRFASSLGNWLARRNYDIILMGSGFASVKAKRLSGVRIEEHNKAQMKTAQKKARILHLPYSLYMVSRLVMSALWVIKIVAMNTKSPISIIHAQDTGYSGLAAIASGKILRIPVIVSSHGIRHKSLESIIKGKFKGTLLKIERHLDIYSVKNGDGVIAVNPSIKKYFEDIVSRRIDFIPIPIDVKKFEFSYRDRYEMRMELGVGEKIVVIGFVGRFSAEKNLITLLESFANVIEHGYAFLKLILVGTGPMESQLKELAKRKSLEDKVTFCGVRYDIRRILSSLDIFVLPSYTEGLSTALLEAMACGRAIICSDIDSNREVVRHDKEGILVDPFNSKELEDAISTLSSNVRLRLRLGESAVIKAAEYNEDALFPKIEQYYRITVESTMAKEKRSHS